MQITKIEHLAFQNCTKLKLDNLPSSLSTIGVGAFGFNDELELTVLPANLTTIGGQAFISCEKLLISEFGTQNSAPKLTSIGFNAFGGSGKNVIQDIYLGKKLGVDEPYLTIEEGAFAGYGSSSANTIYIGDSVKGDVTKFGFDGNDIII